MRVSGTERLGVLLRAAPRPGAERLDGLPEGTPVTVLARADDSWAQVASDDGAAGWVPAEYLAPDE